VVSVNTSYTSIRDNEEPSVLVPCQKGVHIKPVMHYYLLFTWLVYNIINIFNLYMLGNRTHQNEQLFSLPFWRKTLRNGLRKYTPYSDRLHVF
jgi:hypothetical protein